MMRALTLLPGRNVVLVRDKDADRNVCMSRPYSNAANNEMKLTKQMQESWRLNCD